MVLLERKLRPELAQLVLVKIVRWKHEMVLWNCIQQYWGAYASNQPSPVKTEKITILRGNCGELYSSPILFIAYRPENKAE